MGHGPIVHIGTLTVVGFRVDVAVARLGVHEVALIAPL